MRFIGFFFFFCYFFETTVSISCTCTPLFFKEYTLAMFKQTLSLKTIAKILVSIGINDCMPYDQTKNYYYFFLWSQMLDSITATVIRVIATVLCNYPEDITTKRTSNHSLVCGCVYVCFEQPNYFVRVLFIFMGSGVSFGLSFDAKFWFLVRLCNAASNNRELDKGIGYDGCLFWDSNILDCLYMTYICL